jgi:hypothetical protein
MIINRIQKSEVRSRKYFFQFTLIFFLLLQLVSNAQEFTASVKETTVTDNERFQVSFIFSGKSINDLSQFKPPSFEDFLILSGPNQSTSIQFINGVQSASLTYSYLLQAKSTGNFIIEKAIIVQDGTVYETKPINITVVKGSDKPKQQASDSGPSQKEIAENVFIRATVDKQKAYKGEQVTVTYKLYTRLNIASQMSINKLPQYPGFWIEELETPTNISFTTEVIDGKQFRVGLLKRVALFPSQTGKLEVTPFELTVPVHIQKKRSNNIWDDFFGDPFGRSETIQFSAKSNTVRIDVIDFPEVGKPDSFKGAVGKFSLKSDINRTITKTNEPLSLTLTLSGTGNIRLLELPEMNLPAGFEKYEPKVTEKISRAGKISGSKTAEYLFVPRVVGVREIPPMEFSYFDPEQKKYFTLKSNPFTINIEQGEKIPQAEYVGKEDIRKLGEDIRFIKTSYGSVKKSQEYLINKPEFWITSAIPLLAMLALVGWKRRSDKLAGNLVLLRYQKAQKVAKNRLKTAARLMNENNYKEFYTELALALFGYLEDKLHIPKAEFTIERASEELRQKNVSEDLISELKKGAEKCEFVRFAPGAEKTTAMKEMYDELAKVIINIEKNIAEQKYVS